MSGAINTGEASSLQGATMTSRAYHIPDPSLDGEEWRPVRGGFYEASNLGRIRRAVPGTRTYVGKILKIQKSNKYPHVILSLGNRRLKQVAVHQLVAEAFLGPCGEGIEVNHKDLNKYNPRLDNLEYTTVRQNKDHAKLNGAYLSGERHKMVKLKESDVLFIRNNPEIPATELAVKYGMNDCSIRAIRRRLTWKQI
jgi:hypothetical protein